MTQVIFRKYVSENEIIALFPNENANSNGECGSYMHIGQHSPADYNAVIEHTTAATKEEYTPLYNELVAIGYDDLQVITHTDSEYCKYADVVIEWKDTQEQENVKVALFPPEEMNLEADGLTDNDIFFYFLSPNGLIANRLELDGEDFKVVKLIQMY